MDLFSIVGKIWYYKFATIPVILLTVMGALYIIAIKPPTFQATSGVLLINPPAAPTAAQIVKNPKLGQVNANNTFVAFGNLDVVADAVIGVVGAETNHLVTLGADPRYTLALSSDAGLPPMIVVTGVGSTAGEAILSTNLVTQATITSLHQMQVNQKINPTYMIKAVELYAPQQATSSASSKLRTLIAVIALGAILLFVVISFSESLAKRRAARLSQDGRRIRDNDASQGAYQATQIVTDSADRSNGNGVPRPVYHGDKRT